ncbi:MAG: long-chain fatty acid--CoA ligase [Pseudomonadota bacterium]
MTQWNKDVIPLDAARTLDGLFRERVRRTPHAVAYRSFDKTSSAWLDITWAQMAERVACFQAALARERLPPGARVALMLRNGVDWMAFDQAALASGLVVVPLYADDRADNIAYILRDCSPQLLFLHDAAQWKRLQPVRESLSGVQRIVIGGAARGAQNVEDERVALLENWLGDGPVQALPHHTHTSQQLATIVYTSGTTGRPKGVMLSHHNILNSAAGGLWLLDVYPSDVFLSVLPLSHTFERSLGYYAPMMAGAAVAYCRSIPQLGEDLQTVRPHVMISVPRVFERVYMRVQSQLQKRSWLARALFHLAIAVGWRRFEAAQGRARRSPALWLWPLLERLVARKFLARLGGRMRWTASGGAALPAPVARMFIGLGLPIAQGYGLTETSPLISGNKLDDNDPASVGVPIPGMEVRLGANDELLVRGAGVMLGYWNNHSATYAMIDGEGWLHTGDQARIANNHIYITGRLKDILVLSNGEKIPPADMEDAITLDPLFEQAMIVGEGRPHLAALLVLNGEQWRAFAANLGVDADDPASLRNERVRNQIMQRVAKQLQTFPGYAKVRRVALLNEPWTIENGLLTPTLKTKRNVVMQRYAGVIEELFGGNY